jgi:hypothetical protein
LELFVVAFVTGRPARAFKRGKPMLSTILLILLILLLIGALPSWPHSRSWGYYPSGTAAILLIVVIIMLLTGRI